MPVPFQLLHSDSRTKARAGIFRTSHGNFETPMFMPVGTAGAVKAVSMRQLREEVRAQIMLANTYHLYLRPGTETLEKAGGLHRFSGWDGPILTDSGGYQVFSLAANRKITEEGVTFRSHIDGSAHLFSPERVMDIQRSIGADIVMAFDECPPYPSSYEYARNSMELTHRWLDRCLHRFRETPELYGYPQYLFPIVQGGTYPDLRRASCEKVRSVGAPGHAIGGLSVGEPEEILYELTGLCCEELPADRPRYLMGVGTPWNLLECIALGVDMFDCVLPTRNGRNAMLFTSEGVINIDNKKWEQDFSPLDEGFPNAISNTVSRAYLRHLLRAKEILGLTLASIHNLAFYLHLVGEARQRILSGEFSAWKDRMVEQLKTRL